MKFTKYLWKKSEDIYNKIIEHPFITELSEGTLGKDKFSFYIKQDSLYITQFCKALSLIGARADNVETMHQFIKFAEGGVIVEKALHTTYFKLFDIKPVTEYSPVCLSYSNHLLASCALDETAVGIASLLPCFWIYREVGTHIYGKSVKDNVYQEWIDTYAGDVFKEFVEKMIAITDAAAERSSKVVHEKMVNAYLISCKMEYMFWDSAYKKEWFPV